MLSRLYCFILWIFSLIKLDLAITLQLWSLAFFSDAHEVGRGGQLLR